MIKAAMRFITTLWSVKQYVELCRCSTAPPVFIATADQRDSANRPIQTIGIRIMLL